MSDTKTFAQLGLEQDLLNAIAELGEGAQAIARTELMVSLDAMSDELQITFHLLLFKLFASLLSVMFQFNLALLRLVQDFRSIVGYIDASLDLFLYESLLAVV